MKNLLEKFEKPTYVHEMNIIRDNLNKKDRTSVRLSCDAQKAFLLTIGERRVSQELPPLPAYRKPRS